MVEEIVGFSAFNAYVSEFLRKWGLCDDVYLVPIIPSDIPLLIPTLCPSHYPLMVPSVQPSKTPSIIPSELSKVTMDQINNEVKESTRESTSIVPPKIPGHVNNKTD